MDQLIGHLATSKIFGEDQLEADDHVTAAVVVMKVEQVDAEEPQFVVVHTGDYITATGLLALAEGIVLDSIGDDE